jgi:hypothetical protein
MPWSRTEGPVWSFTPHRGPDPLAEADEPGPLGPRDHDPLLDR